MKNAYDINCSYDVTPWDKINPKFGPLKRDLKEDSICNGLVPLMDIFNSRCHLYV